MVAYYINETGLWGSRKRDVPNPVYKVPTKAMALGLSTAIRFPEGRGNDQILDIANKRYRIDGGKQ